MEKLNEGGERLRAPGPEKVDYKDGVGQGGPHFRWFLCSF